MDINTFLSDFIYVMYVTFNITFWGLNEAEISKKLALLVGIKKQKNLEYEYSVKYMYLFL